MFRQLFLIGTVFFVTNCIGQTQTTDMPEGYGHRRIIIDTLSDVKSIAIFDTIGDVNSDQFRVRVLYHEEHHPGTGAIYFEGPTSFFAIGLDERNNPITGVLPIQNIGTFPIHLCSIY